MHPRLLRGEAETSGGHLQTIKCSSTWYPILTHRFAMGRTSPAPEPDRPRMSAPHGWSAQDDEDLRHLVDSGFQLESMAWALNRSPGTIRARLAVLHLAPPAAVPELEPASVESAPSPSKLMAQVGPRNLLGV